MIRGRRCIILLTLLLSGVLGVVRAKEARAAWPTTVATRCWNFGSTTEKLKMKMRITPAGDGFSNVSFILIQGGKVLQVSNGAAYLRGNYVYMAFSSVGKNSEGMWTGQRRLTINQNTMIGTSEAIDHNKHYADGSLDTEYDAGSITLTPVSCATIWQ